VLGDEIYFRDKFPWIHGEMNQLHGRIDIGFGVKGKAGKGYMRFKSIRKTRMGHVCRRHWFNVLFMALNGHYQGQD
jgi:cytochrome c oxidase assembly factor 1